MGYGRTSPEFGVWKANANCPPQILSCFKISSTRLLKAYKYKKARSVASKYTKMRFWPGPSPDPAGEVHDAPLDSQVGWGVDIPPISSLRRSPCVPQIPAIIRLPER